MLVSGESGEKVSDVAGRKREAAEFVQTVDFKFQPCSNSTATVLLLGYENIALWCESYLDNLSPSGWPRNEALRCV